MPEKRKGEALNALLARFFGKSAEKPKVRPRIALSYKEAREGAKRG